jgi:hypothetical protein
MTKYRLRPTPSLLSAASNDTPETRKYGGSAHDIFAIASLPVPNNAVFTRLLRKVPSQKTWPFPSPQLGSDHVHTAGPLQKQAEETVKGKQRVQKV